jgi:hypothetical protein
MRKYQLVTKPLETATGEPGRWSFVAHGAAYTAEEVAEYEALLVEHNRRVKLKKLPI